MSNKLLIGLVSGIAAGVAITLIVRNREGESFVEDDYFDPNEELGNASKFLSTAKKKAEDLVTEAKEKSGILLDEANEILKNAKEKVKSISENIIDDPEKELKSIKEIIEEKIEKLNDKMSDDDNS
ncbi:MAG: YtxH domain-containing protein [Ignavibacteria bacterium]